MSKKRKIILANILHISDMNRNLVSMDLLRKPGIKSVHETRKLILSRNSTFIRKGYSYEEMVKFCFVDNRIIINPILLIRI